jgi:hypothetical protein
VSRKQPKPKFLYIFETIGDMLRVGWTIDPARSLREANRVNAHLVWPDTVAKLRDPQANPRKIMEEIIAEFASSHIHDGWFHIEGYDKQMDLCFSVLSHADPYCDEDVDWGDDFPNGYDMKPLHDIASARIALDKKGDKE